MVHNHNGHKNKQTKTNILYKQTNKQKQTELKLTITAKPIRFIILQQKQTK